MVRLVEHERSKPYILNSKSGESFALCACGLSKNKPLCDGSHKRTQDEEPGVLYVYDETGRTRLVQYNPNPSVPATVPSLHGMKQLE